MRKETLSKFLSNSLRSFSEISHYSGLRPSHCCRLRSKMRNFREFFCLDVGGFVLVRASVIFGDLLALFISHFIKLLLTYVLDFYIPITFNKCKKCTILYFIKYCTLTGQIMGNESGKLRKLPIFRWKSYFKKSLLAHFLSFFIPIAFKKCKKINNFLFHKIFYCDREN